MAPKGKQGKGTGRGTAANAAGDEEKLVPYQGLKPIKAARSPFWAPWDAEAEHPNPIKGAFMGERQIKAHGKFKEQRVLDMETAEDGPYTIAVKGNLSQLLRGVTGGLQQGQTFAVEWVELMAETEELPNGMHRFRLWAE